MTDKTSANLAKVRAEKFGKNLSEALDIMVEFELEGKFDCYNTTDYLKMARVLEILTDFSVMWDKGQIILVSKESEVKQ